MTQTVKNLLAVQETWVLSLGQEDPLEKGMASPFSILAWRISGTAELGRLQSWGHKELDTPECLILCVDLFRLILIETLCFLYLGICFLSQVRDVFSYYFFM